jgi:hypothetical protein
MEERRRGLKLKLSLEMDVGEICDQNKNDC